MVSSAAFPSQCTFPAMLHYCYFNTFVLQMGKLNPKKRNDFSKVTKWVTGGEVHKPRPGSFKTFIPNKILNMLKYTKYIR